jgi:hypothetical protein
MGGNNISKTSPTFRKNNSWKNMKIPKIASKYFPKTLSKYNYVKALQNPM